MADTRKRGQAGTVPPSRNDHAADEQGRPGVWDDRDAALAWSVNAMIGALSRLRAARAADVEQAVASATEAMWWVTVVDAAMIRRHAAPYGQAMTALDPATRRALERSLTGLRYIRSQLGYFADSGDFVQPAPGTPSATWTWRILPPPPPQRGTARDAGLYREYRAQLAGRPLAEALTRSAEFLSLVHASAGRPGHRDIRRSPV